jgi:predicted Kef-type K+ transport protein
MGGIVLILVPLFFIVFFIGAHLVWQDPKFDAQVFKLVSIGSLVIVCSLVGLGLFGFIFGIVGMVSGLVRTQPGGLAVAGTLVCLVAMVLAIILMLATFRLSDDLKKKVESRPQSAAPPGTATARAYFFGRGFSTGVSAALPHSAQLR